MLQHYRSSDIFAEQRMRDWECSSVLDVGVAAQYLVNLQRRNLFASTVDDFIKAPGKKEISIVIEISLIPGSIPFAKERGRVFVCIRFITAEHAGSPHNDFSEVAGR